MLTSKQRIGKELHEMNMSQLIEEFRAMNIEGGTFVRNAIQLNLSVDQNSMLEEKIKEIKEYQKELACEFLGRFLK